MDRSRAEKFLEQGFSLVRVGLGIDQLTAAIKKGCLNQGLRLALQQHGARLGGQRIVAVGLGEVDQIGGLSGGQSRVEFHFFQSLLKPGSTGKVF